MFNWLIIRFQHIYKAMTGNKKEQKKKPCNLSGAGLKEKLGKEKD